MVTKTTTAKVKKTVAIASVEQAPDANISPKNALVVVQADAAPATGTNGANDKSLYIKVTTTDYTKTKGTVIGERIVDMYHFGTRNWLHNHFWWAMHNGHLVETEVATDAEVGAYLAEQKLKLAEKFNGGHSAAA